MGRTCWMGPQPWNSSRSLFSGSSMEKARLLTKTLRLSLRLSSVASWVLRASAASSRPFLAPGASIFLGGGPPFRPNSPVSVSMNSSAPSPLKPGNKMVRLITTCGTPLPDSSPHSSSSSSSSSAFLFSPAFFWVFFWAFFSALALRRCSAFSSSCRASRASFSATCQDGWTLRKHSRPINTALSLVLCPMPLQSQQVVLPQTHGPGAVPDCPVVRGQNQVSYLQLTVLIYHRQNPVTNSTVSTRQYIL
ncbi:hypothetical protein JZ751_001659 [Albula glossodonta]|uniref:Uncharacterized protein n=1 Tax=Albula glossodonta TaxID=121402 RepID=A0A8T2PUL3_9TELE|nr:hypothetical protein JZ751_001659 [Albula glossodonta]